MCRVPKGGFWKHPLAWPLGPSVSAARDLGFQLCGEYRSPVATGCPASFPLLSRCPHVCPGCLRAHTLALR